MEAKFAQNPRVMQALLETGNKELVECAKDTLWGTGVPLNEPNCLNEKYWKGQGILGEILHEIRHKHLQIAQSILPAINQWHTQGPPPLLHSGAEPCKPSINSTTNIWHTQGPPPLLHPEVEPCKPANISATNACLTASTYIPHENGKFTTAGATSSSPTSPTKPSPPMLVPISKMWNLLS